MFWDVLHVSVLLECKVYSEAFFLVLCTRCVTSGVSFSSAPDTSEQMSAEYCNRERAHVCSHINTLQSQQSFGFFFGLRALWVFHTALTSSGKAYTVSVRLNLYPYRIWRKAILEWFSWFSRLNQLLWGWPGCLMEVS